MTDSLFDDDDIDPRGQTDPDVWAAAFYQRIRTPGFVRDVDRIRRWFAEAIRTGYQQAQDEQLSNPAAPAVKVAARARSTSQQAALQALPRTGTQRMRILQCIVASGSDGATDDEMIDELRIAHQSLGPRRGELEEGGWIHDSGERRRTRARKSAIVWVLTDAARRRLSA